MKSIIKTLTVITLMTVLLLAYTYLQLELNRAGTLINLLENQLRDLEDLERLLRLESTYLASPANIDRRARQELGMRSPELNQIVFPGTQR